MSDTGQKGMHPNMGWLRNTFIFPDDVWEEAAHMLGGEFLKGRCLSNSEIKLRHRNHPISLEVQFGTGEDNSQYTRVVPGVALDPAIQLSLLRVEGLLGSIMQGLGSRTGATIKIPALDENYHVIGNDEQIANAIFGHHNFVSALQGLTKNPSIVIGRNRTGLLVDHKQDQIHVSVRRVLKDVHQLIALVDLAKVLLDRLDENGLVLATRFDAN